MSPLTKGLNIVVGMMFIRKPAKVESCAWVT